MLVMLAISSVNLIPVGRLMLLVSTLLAITKGVNSVPEAIADTATSMTLVVFSDPVNPGV